MSAISSTVFALYKIKQRKLLYTPGIRFCVLRSGPDIPKFSLFRVKPTTLLLLFEERLRDTKLTFKQVLKESKGRLY